MFLDPGRVAAPRVTAPLILRSTITTASAPAMRQFRGSIDTPCNCCVRFVAVVTAGSRNTHYRVARYGLLGPVFHRLDRASHTGAFGKLVQTDPTAGGRLGSGPSGHQHSGGHIVLQSEGDGIDLRPQRSS